MLLVPSCYRRRGKVTFHVTVSVGNAWLQVAENLNHCVCVWGGEVLLKRGLEASCCLRGWAAHRHHGSFLLFSWPFLQGHKMAALAPGITSRTWSREEMWEGVISATLMSFSWTLNFLGQPLACRLCSSLIGQNHVPWKSWLHKTPERVFSFCSFYTGEEKGVETPLGWSTQQRRP